MKKIKSLLTFLILSGGLLCYSNPKEIPNEVITALSKSDVATLSSFLNDNVELSIENKNDIYSKQQAKNIISDFFRKNEVTGFTLLHKGEKESSCFIIGTLNTSNEAFRVYILTRRNGKKDLIQQFRIEVSNE